MSGYNEIQNPSDRYGVIDQRNLQQLCGFSDSAQFVEQHRKRVQEAIATGRFQLENCWTESVAVGNMEFIEETKLKLGISAKGRRIDALPDGLCALREESEPYGADLAPKNKALSAVNAFFWDDSRNIS